MTSIQMNMHMYLFYPLHYTFQSYPFFELLPSISIQMFLVLSHLKNPYLFSKQITSSFYQLETPKPQLSILAP